MNISSRKSLLLIFFLFLFVLLEIIPIIFRIPEYLLPPTHRILLSLWNDKLLLAYHFSTTFYEWSIGLLLSIISAILFAILALRFFFIEKIGETLFIVTQSVPYLIFTPFLLIWLGLGILPKIFLVYLTCTFPILMVLNKEFSSAKNEYQNLGILFQLTFFQKLKHIYFPYSLKGFLQSLKLSSCYSFGTAVVAELMGSEEGLGVYLQRSQSSYRLDQMMAVVFVILVFTLGIHFIIEFIETKMIFWTNEKN